MKDFVKRMIAEHQELVERIAKLDEYVYTEKSDNDDKVEFANKCIQLAAMKKYEEALRARLENQNIVCTGEEYFEHIDKYDVNYDVKCEVKQKDNTKVCKDCGNDKQQ